MSAALRGIAPGLLGGGGVSVGAQPSALLCPTLVQNASGSSTRFES
jgi:hypothetical protein